MPPPEKLFIYEIEGRVYPPDDLTGEDFLGCWREGGYSYLFFGTPREAAVQAWVATLEGARYSSENVMNYADWEAGQPLQKTSMAGFHLCPVWEDPTPGPGELVIRMEPGLAFGSGYHPTTRTCRRPMRLLRGKEYLRLGRELLVEGRDLAGARSALRGAVTQRPGRLRGWYYLAMAHVPGGAGLVASLRRRELALSRWWKSGAAAAAFRRLQRRARNLSAAPLSGRDGASGRPPSDRRA